MVRRSWKTVKVGLSLPETILKSIDAIAEEVEITRSETIVELVLYGLREDNLGEIFPEEGKEEEEEEEAEEESD